ncbi:MAG: hypothetical protein HGA77_04920 [Chlorobiaceae bacterium]|nr:hypothetical protein [Chlorobiaceae bacterium]
MSTVGEINVRIGGDNSELKSKLKESGALVETFGNQMAMVTSAFAALGIGLGAAELVGFLKDCITLGGEAERAGQRLESVLKATGNAAGFTAEELSKYASELQKATTFDDDDIKSMMAVLGTFRNIAGPTFKEATEAALNMSVILGQDLKSSALQLGKALNDPIIGITALQRVGIQFTETQKDLVKSLWESGRAAEAQAIILKEVRQEMGRAARDEAKTLSGQMQQLSVDYGNLREDIGMTNSKFIEETGAVNDLRESMKLLSSFMKTNSDDIQATFKAISWTVDKLASSIWGLNNAYAVFKMNMEKMRTVQLIQDVNDAGGLDKSSSGLKMMTAESLGVVPKTGGGDGNGSGNGKSKAQTEAEELAKSFEKLKKSLQDEIEAENERYEKSKQLIVAFYKDKGKLTGEANAMMLKFEQDHKKKLDEINGVPAMKKELEELRNHFKTKRELELDRFKEQMADLEKWRKSDIVSQLEFNDLKEQLEKEHQDKLNAIDKEGWTERQKFMNMSLQEQVKDVFGTLANITSGVAQYNKTMFEINKVAGIANALINTYEAYTKTIAKYPGPLGIALAATTLAAGLAQVMAISQTSFNGGGKGSAPSVAGSTAATPVSDVSGGTSKSVTIYGLNPSNLYTGQQVAELLNEFIADGGTVNIR